MNNLERRGYVLKQCHLSPQAFCPACWSNVKKLLRRVEEECVCFLEARDDELPEDLEAWNKFPDYLTPGDRIGWWFDEDWEYALEFCTDVEEEDEDRRVSEANGRAYHLLQRTPPYSGIVVPAPDVENCVGNLDPEKFVVVMDTYPTEKCPCEATYIALRRLADNETLLQVVKMT